MDRLAACHVMHGFLNIHKETRKRNSSLPGNHGRKPGHRSHSLSERKGVINAFKDENKKNSHVHHQGNDSQEKEGNESFNSIFHRVLDYSTTHATFYPHQIETLLDPVNKMPFSKSSKYKIPSCSSDILNLPKCHQKNNNISQSNVKCGYLLLSINYNTSQNKLIIHIEKGANLPISQSHKKSVSYIKAVLIQNHQFVNCAKSKKFISTPFIYFDTTFTFKLNQNQPTLSMLILVIQKSNNIEERELGHLIFSDEETPNNQLEDLKIESEKKGYNFTNTIINQYSVNEVSKQNEIIPLSYFIGRQKLYNQSDYLVNEYQSILDKEICNWFKLSNKW
uniref:C2 domain-containing protein n=1 Tax=Strongyloides papillosus TaxID=174720 RepID=A0A0N5BBG0_STREA